MAQVNVDLKNMNKLRKEIDQLKEETKSRKSQYDVMESQAITALIRLDRRVLDMSGEGKGPFMALGKRKSDGSWNVERYNDFFGNLLRAIQQGQVKNEKQCTELAINYLKKFEKRGLTLNEVKHPPRRNDTQDLQAWVRMETDE